MEKVYIIKELYDVDGGFGDAIPQERIMAITRDEGLAKAYVEKYNKPRVYDIPYAALTEHGLAYEAVELIDPDLDVDPWANTTRTFDYDDED